MRYEVSGNREKTLGITAIAKHYNQNINVFSPGKELGNTYYLTKKERKKSIVIDNITGEKSIHTPTCFNISNGIFEKGKFKGEIISSNKPNLFHLSFADHATSYLLDNKQQILLDFSLAHCEKDENGIVNRANRDYFDKYSDYIELLNRFPMQINGTCSFYADAFLSVVGNPANNYNSIEKVKEDCGNGTMWLKVAAEMGKTFDVNQDYPTVKEFSDESKALDENGKYVIFNKNGTFFGISKECYNNKFMDMEALIKCLQTNQQTNTFGYVYDTNGEPLEQKLSKQIELQKEIIKAQRMMYLYYHVFRYFIKLFELQLV